VGRAGTALGEVGGEGFDLSTLSTPQLRRYLYLTEEGVIERLDEETLAEKVERVVDIAERFMADPRDVSPAEVTEAKALLVSVHHYERVLAPIRKLRVDWREPKEPVSDIPPEPRVPWEGSSGESARAHASVSWCRRRQIPKIASTIHTAQTTSARPPATVPACAARRGHPSGCSASAAHPNSSAKTPATAPATTPHTVNEASNPYTPRTSEISADTRTITA
jgi:hypothetical protein